MRALCSGLTRAKTVVAVTASTSCSSSRVSRSVPVSTPSPGRPRSWQTLAATTALSPVTTLTRMPSAASRARAAAASGLGGSRKTSNPTSCRSCSSAGSGARDQATGRVATATTRLPAANSASRAARVAGATSGHRASTVSGAPFVTRWTAPASSRRATESIRRSWSKGSWPTTSWPVSERRAAAVAGDSQRAWSSGLPATAAASPWTWSEQSSPQRTTSSERRPTTGTALAKSMRPAVSVPVLSVKSTSTSPRSSMQTSLLTSTLRRPICRDPAARLVDTTAGSSCGVMPTATAREADASTASVVFSTGCDSPDSTDSSHSRPATVTRRRSAGTTSPRVSSTTSPGTRVVTSTRATSPSRSTTASWLTCECRDAAVTARRRATSSAVRPVVGSTPREVNTSGVGRPAAVRMDVVAWLGADTRELTLHRAPDPGGSAPLAGRWRRTSPAPSSAGARVGQSVTIPRRRAMAAASVRPDAPSLASRLETCTLTVFVLM